MDSLCNYGSDDEHQQHSQHKSSYNAATDWQNEQDVNYEPVTMDMSEDSNEEEYYARKYGKYSDVAEAAARRRFDPYEDDVSDAPTSPEPDPPTGWDPSNGHAQHTNQHRGNEERRDTCDEEKYRDYSSNERRYSREEGRGSTNQERGNARREESEVARQYPSYYERAKRKLSGEDIEDNDGDDRNSNKSSDKPSSGGFPPFKGDRRERRRSRSHDRDHKSSSKHKYRKRSHEREKRRKRDSRSRSRSRDRYERKSSRRHRSRSRSHSRSRSSSKSRSHHSSHSSRHRRDRRSREPSIGDLPRPYAPYERKPNKLQILEKLGIELKVQQTPSGSGQPPHVIAVPTSKAVGASGTAGIPSLLGISTVNPITGAVGPSLLSTSGAASVTPQDLIQKSIAAQVEKIKADTGIELPKYYNPMAINPTKMAEQIQKRRLLWGNKAPNTTASTTVATPTPSSKTTPASSTTQPSSSQAATSKTPGTIWQGATFSGDRDGRLTNKFQRLMGMKNAGSTETPAASEVSSTTQPRKSSSGGAGGVDMIRKQEEMFNSMESQYEAARMATHTHRGLGLGFGTFAPR